MRKHFYSFPVEPGLSCLSAKKQARRSEAVPISKKKRGQAIKRARRRPLDSAQQSELHTRQGGEGLPFLYVVAVNPVNVAAGEPGQKFLRTNVPPGKSHRPRRRGSLAYLLPIPPL